MSDRVAKIKTVSYEGLSSVDTEVQTHLGSGLPCFSIVGMANRAVMEARDRIRAVLGAVGLNFPSGRVIVNLSPVNLVKDGNHYDLPIILSLLIAMEVLPQQLLEGYVCVGELGLDGSLLSTGGVLPAAVFVEQNKYRGLICPLHNGSEASWVRSIKVKAAGHLMDLVNHLLKNASLPKCSPPELHEQLSTSVDFSQIRGQETAKRAMEVAAAGNHHVLLIGPPGAGKSMLARALASILPPLTEKDLLILSMIYSLSGRFQKHELSLTRPFRAPHHTSSAIALVGGGAKAMPGEISLCHKGVLFLDELPEFGGSVLDTLREPLESGVISIARANRHVQYPADFQLVAAMNPCRCGGGDNTYYTCRRGDDCAARYQARVSGPFLDRLEVKLQISALTSRELLQENAVSEGSETIRQRVIRARQMHIDQQKHAPLTNEMILKFLTNPAKQSLKKLIHNSKISARGYACLIKLARSIANLEQSESIDQQHVLEAFMYHRINHEHDFKSNN